MRPIALAWLAALAPLALSGCGDTDETAEAPPAAMEEVEENASTPAPPSPSAIPTQGALPREIPNQLQGRWGLTAEDCELDEGDNTGLLRVSDRKLEFYESVGTVGAVTQAEPTRMRGVFSFTGEGMEWEREMALERGENGEELVRREFGEDAAPRAFRYTRCP